MDLQPLTTTIVATADRAWLMSQHGVPDAVESVTIDITTLTPAATYIDDVNAVSLQKTLKSGIPLGKITASGLYGLYKSDATDGRQNFAGVLLTSVAFNPTSTKVVAPMLFHGVIKPSLMPGAPTLPATITPNGPLFRYV